MVTSDTAAKDSVPRSAESVAWDRARILAMFAGTGVYVLLYMLLMLTGLAFTGLLFLLLPLFSAMLVAALVSRREHVMSTCFLSLLFNACASFLFLGEGVICVLMASPVFAGMTFAGAAAIRKSRFADYGPPRWTAWVLIAAFAGYASYDAVVLARGVPERAVITSINVPIARAEAWRGLSFDRPPVATMPKWLFALPAPDRYAFAAEGLGAERCVDYGTPVQGDDADRPRGRMVYRITTWSPEQEAVFTCVRNETCIGRWVELLETRVTLEDLPAAGGAAGTRVTFTTRYRRRLGPDFYFVPLMDAVIAEMHGMLAGELREGAR